VQQRAEERLHRVATSNLPGKGRKGMGSSHQLLMGRYAKDEAASTAINE
jgi:hypothetical protein